MEKKEEKEKERSPLGKFWDFQNNLTLIVAAIIILIFLFNKIVALFK